MLRSGLVTLDYPEPVAADYPDCLAIVEAKVRPERARNNRAVYRDRWWHYVEKRPDLYASISSMERVISVAATSRTLAFAFAQANYVFSHATYVFALDRFALLAVLQSAFHDTWARKWASSMRTDLRYTPSDCFETFPFPPSIANLEDIGHRYYTLRQTVMRETGKGLTATYNRFHDRHEALNDIQQLRNLHVEMDCAVAHAYGWDDLDLRHGLHQTRQGERFTISEGARRTVFDRLLKLNHERHAAEVTAGLFDEKKPKAPRARKAKDVSPHGLLF